MPDLDEIRDAMMLILQGKKDWMTMSEIQSGIHFDVDLESWLKALNSLVRQGLAEEKYFDENRVNLIRKWKAINMLSTKDADDGS